MSMMNALIDGILMILNRCSRAVVSRNYRIPEDSVIGRTVMKLVFEKRNAYLEKQLIEQSCIRPEDKVLEVGFGSGLGLKYAIEKASEGHVYGVDISPLAHKYASNLLQVEIAKGQLTLFRTSVTNIPLNNCTVDKIIHCNAFYFWPNLPLACSELYRLLVPGGTMTTTINIKRIQEIQRKKILLNANTDLVGYMACLEHVGFTGVNIKYLNDSHTGKDFQCVFASKPFTSDGLETKLEST